MLAWVRAGRPFGVSRSTVSYSFQGPHTVYFTSLTFLVEVFSSEMNLDHHTMLHSHPTLWGKGNKQVKLSSVLKSEPPRVLTVLARS